MVMLLAILATNLEFSTAIPILFEIPQPGIPVFMDHHIFHHRPGQDIQMPSPSRILIILIILTLAVASHANDTITGKVVGVADGDTITVHENRTQHRIR